MQHKFLFSVFLSLILFFLETKADTNPPEPSPSEWRMAPEPSGATSIKMAAITATDPDGVEYYFECMSGGCNHSGWQSSPIYEDTGLTEGNTYTYRVKARDLSVNQNTTLYSAAASAVPVSAKAGGFTYNWGNYDNSDSVELGSRQVTFDFTDIRTISHAPPIGVHPRVYFGPDEVPDIINRMNNTESGQQTMAQIHAYTTLMHKGYVAGGYSHSAPYAQTPCGGRLIDNAGYWDQSTWYAKLVAEDPTALDGNNARHRLASVFSMEAFECMVKAGQTDPDTGLDYDDRAADLATAMAFWASLVIGDPDLNPNNHWFFGTTHMALAYDINYNNMTTAQQDIVRQALAELVPTVPRHGGYTTAYNSQSNWATLNAFEAMINFAIEGETGYKPELTDRWFRALYNFLTYGWYPSGAGYEGLGKNYQMVGTMVAFAKRGYSILGHPNVRPYGNQFLPAITQPFGYSFTTYDVWGGSGRDAATGGYRFEPSDAVGLKWAFPNDPAIDFMWRNYIEMHCDDGTPYYGYQRMLPGNYYNDVMIQSAVYAQDFTAGDWATQNETALNSETDYLAIERGLGVLRSGFSPDDLAVQFHCRQDMGGHTHGDRLDFTLSALGRIWVRKSYSGSQFQPTYYHSCLLIDDLGVGVGDPDGDKCRQPSTLVDWQPDPNMTLIAGDATYAYTWEWHWQARDETEDHSWLGTNGWEAVTETWNDFLQLQPGTEPFYDIPFYDYAHWTQPNKLERMIKRPYNPMDRVIRSVAMVKGNHPFVLIVDDVEKDGLVHNYKWVAQMAHDLTIESTAVNLVDNNYQCDIVMTDGGNKRLLVRVLNNNGHTGTPGYLDTLVYNEFFSGVPFNPNPGGIDRKRLVVEADVIAPDFKVMLFPYIDGGLRPVTDWNATHDTLTVTIGTEVQTIAFEAQPNGRTLVDLIVPPHTLQVTAFLEGAYNSTTGQMNTTLDDQNLLPLTQPFNTAPWNYQGTESVVTNNDFPPNTVDWVLVEIRDGNDISTIVERKAVLLGADGTCTDLETMQTGVQLHNLVTGNSYYVALRHRNHLDIMGSNTVVAGANMAYNFTDAAQVQDGINQLVDLNGVLYGLLCGDFNGDGILSVSDFNFYTTEASILNQYVLGDGNLNGSVTVSDFNLYLPNSSVIGVSEVRY